MNIVCLVNAASTSAQQSNGQSGPSKLNGYAAGYHTWRPDW